LIGAARRRRAPVNRASERDKDATFWRRACEKAYCVTSATSCQNVFFVWRSVLTPIAKTVTFPFLKTARALIFSELCFFSLLDERDVEASGFLRRGAARRPFSLAHPHVQRLTGKMAKSTNHTAHNQSYKNHRNGACCPRPGAPRGVDPGEARCFHAIAKHSRRETYISAASARRPRGVCASCAANDPGSDARSSGTP